MWLGLWSVVHVIPGKVWIRGEAKKKKGKGKRKGRKITGRGEVQVEEGEEEEEEAAAAAAADERKGSAVDPERDLVFIVRSLRRTE